MPDGMEYSAKQLEFIKNLIGGPFSNIKGLPGSLFMVVKKKGNRVINFTMLEKHLDSYLSHWSLDEIKTILASADDAYYNGASIMSDSIYDKIHDFYKSKAPESKTSFGHTQAPVHGTAVALPIHMGSMDKLKPGSSQLQLFFNQYKNPKCIMDKLDGTSLLVDFRDPDNLQAFTRGNGTMGHDVSHLIPYINGLKNVKKDSVDGLVRGEVIVKKADWSNLSGKYANARNFVSGVMNRKTLIPSDFTYIQFVAYNFIGDNDQSISGQLKHLKSCNFNVVAHKLYFPKAITADKLPGMLEKFRDNSEYEVDGIIIQDNFAHPLNTSGNPKYAKAFKMDSMCENAITEVLDVIWQPSKTGSLKPVVQVKPCKLAGVTIQRATGYNGSFIESNGIGKGAKVEIIRSGDVIPKITKVIEKAAVSYPSVDYKWDDNHTDLLLVEKTGNKEVIIKQLTHFVSTLGIQFFKGGQITKAYEAGFTTCMDIVQIDKTKLLKVEGIKERGASKIMGSIVGCCENVPVHILAAATPCFQSFGKRRVLAIVENIPEFMSLDAETLKNKIVSLDGFSNKTADVFMEGLPSFKDFLEEYSKVFTVSYASKTNTPENTTGKFSGKVFLFSGFRDKDLRYNIETNGGVVVERLSGKNNVTHLIVKDINSLSQKVVSAKEKGIAIITSDQLASI